MKAYSTSGKSFLLISFVVFVSFFSGCVSDSDSDDGGGGGDNDILPIMAYQNANLPTGFTVDLPKSLKSDVETDQSQGLGSIGYQQLYRLRAGSTTPPGYKMLTSSIKTLRSAAKNLDIQFMLMDAFYEKAVNATNPSDIPPNSFSIVISAEMAQRMIETSVDGIKETDPAYNDIVAEMKAMIGKETPCPAMKYQKDDHDIDQDGYHTTITYYDFDSLGGDSGDGAVGVCDGACENDGSAGNTSDSLESTSVIKWNTEKTRVSFSTAYNIESAGSCPEGSEDCSTTGSFINSDKFVYDKAAGRMSYKNTQTSSTPPQMSSLSLVFEETELNNGVKISLKTSQDLVEIKGLWNMEGVADDNGGYIIESMTDSSGDTVWYKELFDGKGQLLGAMVSEDGTNWSDQSGFTPWSGLEDTYSHTSPRVETHYIVSISSPVPESDIVFVVVPAGTPDSSTDIEAFIANIIGLGACCEASGDSLFFDYWGGENQAIGAVVYHEEINNDGLSYTEISGAAISRLTSPETE